LMHPDLLVVSFAINFGGMLLNMWYPVDKLSLKMLAWRGGVSNRRTDRRGVICYMFRHKNPYGETSAYIISLDLAILNLVI
jgi:hypothetical protein